MQSYFAALASGDETRLVRCFTEDAVWTAPGQLPNSGTWSGARAIVEEFFPIATRRMVPGSMSTKMLSLTYGENNAIVEWETEATIVDGRTYTNSYMANFIISGDRIFEVREYFDTQQGQTLYA